MITSLSAEILEQKLHYKHWYFGHYHRDCQPDERHTLVYYAILPLEQKESAAAGIFKREIDTTLG